VELGCVKWTIGKLGSKWEYVDYDGMIWIYSMGGVCRSEVAGSCGGGSSKVAYGN
jgi:hypothetical protein